MPKYQFTAVTSTGKYPGDIEAPTVEDAVLHLDSDLAASGRGQCKYVVIDGVAHHPEHIRANSRS